jgi:hypothetical protein
MTSTHSSRIVGPLFVSVLAAILLMSATATQQLSALSPFFPARLNGPTLDHHVADLDDAFAFGDGAIHRNPVAQDRHYITTVHANYNASSWTYELTVRTPPNAIGEILFIGFGEGTPDPTFFNEPKNSVNFRIHQGGTAVAANDWRVDVAAHDTGIFSFPFIRTVGSLPTASGGSFIVRIRKIGPQVTFAILGKRISLTIPDIQAVAPFLNTAPSRIFFGSASGTFTFRDMRVLPEAGPFASALDTDR